MAALKNFVAEGAETAKRIFVGAPDSANEIDGLKATADKHGYAIETSFTTPDGKVETLTIHIDRSPPPKMEIKTSNRAGITTIDLQTHAVNFKADVEAASTPKSAQHKPAAPRM